MTKDEFNSKVDLVSQVIAKNLCKDCPVKEMDYCRPNSGPEVQVRFKYCDRIYSEIAPAVVKALFEVCLKGHTLSECGTKGRICQLSGNVCELQGIIERSGKIATENTNLISSANGNQENKQ